MKSEAEERIKKIREEVKEITGKIIEALAYRLSKAEEIGRLKLEAEMPTLDLQVERELRGYVENKAKELGLESKHVKRILTLMLGESVRRQAESKGRPKLKGITHIDVFRRAKQLELEGKEIIHLEVGEPDFGAPREVARKLTEYALAGYAFYGDAKGRPELRSAISEYLAARLGVDVNPENIVVTPGGRYSIYAAAAAILEPGDEALVIDPSWPMYKQALEYLDARTITIDAKQDNGWVPDVKVIEDFLSTQAKLLFINYPNNPTGATIDKGILMEIVDLCRDRGVYLLSDEVYMDYSFSDFHSALEFGYDKTIMVMSFSKSWGMTGYRIGFLVADRATVERVVKIQSMMLTCVPEFIQMAATEALKDFETPKRYREAMRQRMLEVCKILDEMPVSYVKPSGGMYIFPRFNVEGFDSASFSMKLLEEKGVAIAPGSAFGSYPEYVRLSMGASLDKLLEGVKRIKSYLKGWS